MCASLCLCVFVSGCVVPWPSFFFCPLLSVAFDFSICFSVSACLYVCVRVCVCVCVCLVWPTLLCCPLPSFSTFSFLFRPSAIDHQPSGPSFSDRWRLDWHLERRIRLRRRCLRRQQAAREGQQCGHRRRHGRLFRHHRRGPRSRTPVCFGSFFCLVFFLLLLLLLLLLLFFLVLVSAVRRLFISLSLFLFIDAPSQFVAPFHLSSATELAVQ